MKFFKSFERQYLYDFWTGFILSLDPFNHYFPPTLTLGLKSTKLKAGNKKRCVPLLPNNIKIKYSMKWEGKGDYRVGMQKQLYIRQFHENLRRKLS